MRTISSLTCVGTLLPPRKVGCPLPLTELFAGKIPAVSSACAFGSSMQDGIVLLGNGLPCTTPAGAAPPGQFLKRIDDETALALGTFIGMLLGRAPLYQAVLG